MVASACGNPSETRKIVFLTLEGHGVDAGPYDAGHTDVVIATW